MTEKDSGGAYGARVAQYEILIVGGGSAGATLASRLSEDPRRRVLLLEGGPAWPAGATPEPLRNPADIADPRFDWGFEGRAGADTSHLAIPRGRALGGSSAVNAAVAIRARREDVARWADRYGVTDWAYDDVLRDYRSLENNPDGADDIHGRSGPLSVRQRTMEELTPSCRAFVEAAVADGFDYVDDFSGPRPAGAGPYPVTIVDEVRQNVAIGFLPAEVRARPNLTIVGDTVVDKVLFERDRAVGVRGADGETHFANEVVLSAGVYGSPAILLRSGIGPADSLRQLGLSVRADLPVGQHLHDQPFYSNVYELAEGTTDMTPATGALLWARSSEAAEDELDLHISVTHLIAPSASSTGGAIVLAIAVTQPESRGTLSLASTDPHDAPRIDLNFLATERDRRRLLEGVRLSRRLARSEHFRPYNAGEMAPGESVSDDDLQAVVFANLTTYSHPTGTVPMGGLEDPWAVADSTGAVRGVTGLRVVDASLLPEVPSTVTNLTTVMLAERIARVCYQ